MSKPRCGCCDERVDEYIVVCHYEHDMEYMMECVSVMLHMGYACVGGIAVRRGSQSGAYLMQAMVKSQ